MKITILGNNSALPAFGRYPTSQVVTIEGENFLLDCGEGAQMRMQQFGIRSYKIKHVFISHLHGDHYFGLVGFISSQSLLGRTQDLFVYCPPGLKKIIDMQLPWNLGFTIHYHYLQDGISEIIVDSEKIEVLAFPVYHSIPTHGFLIKEKKRKRILIPEKVRHYEIPMYFYKQLSNGENYERPDGTLIENEWVTSDGKPCKSYAYTADTRYAPEIIPIIKHADLLYHETTYLQDQELKAAERMHSTTIQAATIAKEAEAKQLIVGHFSSKYKNLESFIEEVKPIFPNMSLALEGSTYEI